MKILKRKTLAALLALSLLASLLPLGAQPAQAAAPSGQVIYVGNHAVTSGDYWTTDASGNITAYSGEGAPTDNYIHYDAADNTLTLHNATIRESVSSNTNTYVMGAGIGVFNQNDASKLTIKLEGSNAIENVSTGICVLAFSYSTGDASLTITGDGSLDTSGRNNPAIRVQSNGGNATLSIENAKVTATASSSGYGVLVQSKKDSSVSLTVDGGSLTATGSGNDGAGIQLLFGSGDSGSGTPTVTVSNNAIMRASGNAGGITSNASAATPSGKGIVFNGRTGTVYGNVTLQNDLEIGEGESLKLASGANLSVGDHNVIVNGGSVDEGLKSSVISRDAFTFPENLTLAHAVDSTAMYLASGDITLDKNIALNGDGKLVIYGSYGQGESGFALKNEENGQTATVTICVTDMTPDGTYLATEQTRALAVFDANDNDYRVLVPLYEGANEDKLPPGTYKGNVVLYAGYTTKNVTAGAEVTDVDLDKLWKYEIPVTLTLKSLIDTQPGDQSVIEGTSAAFSVSASSKVKNNAELTYQWQESVDGGKNWTNITEATSATYTITDTTTAISGNQYRCVVTSDMDGVVETSKAATLTVTAASYSLSVDKSTLDFGSITEGEAQPGAQVVTVKNTGNQTVMLEQPTAENFEIGTLSAKELKPNAIATFTIQPKDKLPRGSYSEQIVVSNTNGEKAAITATFTVKEPPYTGKYSYEVSTSVGDHGSLTVDRYATEGEKVTITVTPDEAYKLDDLSVTAGGKEVTLTAGGDGTYTFTMPSADVKISATFAEDPDWSEPEEPATDVSEIFIDVAPNAWYKDAVQYAYDNGLMTGVSANEFAPEQTTTRAMIVSMLARLEGVESANNAGFADVSNEWYATAVNWAANVGVVNGYEDSTFRPNTAITREQLAAILMNYAQYKGQDVSARADLTSYTDQPSTWAQEAISWSVAEGLLTGVTADTLQPQGAATRAQVAAILQRFLSE